MKAWHDEWRRALLSLCLRDEQLFQGETVNIQVCVETMPSVDSCKAPEGKQKKRNSARVLQRWKEHFEEARVHIRVEEVSKTDQQSANSSGFCRPPLLRQETQFSHVFEGKSGEGDELVVVLKTQFDLMVCHDFWDRPLLLILHITPKEGAVYVDQRNSDDLALVIRDILPMGPSLLRDEWVSSQLLSLTREQAQPALPMTRRVEQRIIVTKPLHLALESRELTGQRVGILARVSNTHSTLALAVRDLRLHLDQSLRAQNEDVSRFCIVTGDKPSFPIVLQPQERFNFLFVLKPAGMVVLNESTRLDEDNLAMSTTSTLQKKVVSPLLQFSTTYTPQRTSLTLSWKTLTISMDAITETCAIVWYPKAPSKLITSLPYGEDEFQVCIRKLATPLLGAYLPQGKRLYAEFECVPLLLNSVLQMTVAPLPSSALVGIVVTASVTVVNHSMRTDFDLTLVHPSQGTGVINGNICAASVVVGSEGSQRLGLVRPGMSVEQSLHLVFLRSGMCRLGPLILVDHLTRTCFIADDTNVFVKN